jgi:hypothetical protein
MTPRSHPPTVIFMSCDEIRNPTELLGASLKAHTFSSATPQGHFSLNTAFNKDTIARNILLLVL